MSISYGFFNSNNGDRLYDAHDFNRLLECLWPAKRGLMPQAEYYDESQHPFDIDSISGLDVTVCPGIAVVDSLWLYSDGFETLTLPAADVAFDRWDALVVKMDSNQMVRRNTLEIYTGIPSENPTKPTPSETSTVQYLVVWWIFRPRGSSTVTKSATTYEYNNSAICYSMRDYVQMTSDEVARLEAEISSAALMTESKVREIAQEEINNSVGSAINGSY